MFDELGVDHLFIDEAHYFKNLETPTKMDRVAGIQTGGSERAFDLYMKARYLDEQHPGHGVTFATGTPITNTMVEMYTMQRFLDPEGLQSRGIEHFDAWAATFGEVVDTMEISPDGAALRPRSRFARFINLPELQQMFRAFADVQTAEMLDLPRPRLEGGKPIVVACPMSEEQAALQQELVARYDRLRTQKVDPREDNALAITTDGRKLALDARLLSATADGFPRLEDQRPGRATSPRSGSGPPPTRGTQMIFCDMGVQPDALGLLASTTRSSTSSVARGIPREQIAAIGDADTDAKKQALFEKVRSGSVRVLIGSTQKMGTGTNVQKRLVALHHLDAPWKPAEVEQREGRILRQGNEQRGGGDLPLRHRRIVRRLYVAGPGDQGPVHRPGDDRRVSAVRRAEDIGGQELSYAEVKAIASGNPAVLTLAEADAELQRLAILQEEPRRRAVPRPPAPTRAARDHRPAEGDNGGPPGRPGDDRRPRRRDRVTIGGNEVHRDDVLAVLGHRLESLPEDVRETSPLPARHVSAACTSAWCCIPSRRPRGLPRRGDDPPRPALPRASRPAGRAQRPRAAGRAATNPGATPRGRTSQSPTASSATTRPASGRPFPHDAYLAELTRLRDGLKAGLSAPAGDPTSSPLTTVVELAERIKALKLEHAVDATPRRTSHRRETTAEEPVSARIRRRAASVTMPQPDTGPEFDQQAAGVASPPSEAHDPRSDIQVGHRLAPGAVSREHARRSNSGSKAHISNAHI